MKRRLCLTAGLLALALQSAWAQASPRSFWSNGVATACRERRLRRSEILCDMLAAPMRLDDGAGW